MITNPFWSVTITSMKCCVQKKKMSCLFNGCLLDEQISSLQLYEN